MKNLRLAISLTLITVVLALSLYLYQPSQNPQAPPIDPDAIEPPVNVFRLYMTEDCECCKEYASYLESRGYRVEQTILKPKELVRLKHSLGIPERLWSCHTGVLGSQVVEGHVPVEAIEKLTAEDRGAGEKPRGIALPGMPPGAPGMPGKTGSFTIYYFDNEGKTGVFTVVGGD